MTRGERINQAEQQMKASEAGIKLDVRELECSQRHMLIFQTFSRLQPGEAIILINDHDPKPLYYQFQFHWAGRFAWDYLEQGPQAWQVKISKVQNTAQ